MPNVKVLVTKSSESKTIEGLHLNEEVKRLAELEKGGDPVHRIQLVVEFHKETGYFVILEQRVLRHEFGGELFQEQGLRQMDQEIKAMEKWRAASGGNY